MSSNYHTPRGTRVYAERVEPARQFEGYDPDKPIAGFYRMRLRSGGVFVGIRIWYGQPLDPVTGEEMDRSLRWQALANGKPIPLDQVWPRCADDRVSETEYAYLTSLQGWAEQHAPESAFADPTKKIDLLSPQTPLPF